jgi:hypothetical protein
MDFSDFDLPDELKKQLEDLLKENLGNISDEHDFFNRMTLLFHEKYKAPSEAYKGMQKLAYFTIYMMIKSAAGDVKNESTSLFLISLLTPMSMMMNEVAKGLRAVSAVVDEEIRKYTLLHPEILREARIRFESMAKQNAEALKRFEAEGTL